MNPLHSCVSHPCVSIGIPVYNGEKYLREGLDSLLQQTFTDFEIIISDNASTDSTEQICQEYAQRDRRIKYYRNETNLGPTANYAKLTELAQGDYFKWHNYDDTCAPEFLARCVEVLNQHPDVILCHTRMNCIDSQGQVTEAYCYDLQADEPSTPHRFGKIICVDHRRHAASELFGLIDRPTTSSPREICAGG
jgi:glycosyltransferase involved in cell wall biosynthesis